MSRRRKIWLWVTSLLVAFLLGFNVFFQIDHTEGDSMAPTLRDGQWLLVARNRTVALTGAGYHYGDIVIVVNQATNLDENAHRLLVKRLIGKPGDLISVSRYHVFRNLKQLKEPYVYYPMDNRKYDYDGEPGAGLLFQSTHYMRSTALHKGQYFILGDNRPISADSRWFGPINQDQLHGKVVAQLAMNDHVAWQKALGVVIRFLPLGVIALWLLGLYGPSLARWWRRRKRPQ
ncbi:signal peptidase I [Lacticaseibacillus parakribbianus]|uniref:signal peptidase I n=1 Tax=Lacticaseibacillus parakribbianus TaxID=2970927 RepID=UPI0021CB7741|nr:signal peptidase I [Lacticaseibacillus parakribbianus]